MREVPAVADIVDRFDIFKKSLSACTDIMDFKTNMMAELYRVLEYASLVAVCGNVLHEGKI